MSTCNFLNLASTASLLITPTVGAAAVIRISRTATDRRLPVLHPCTGIRFWEPSTASLKYSIEETGAAGTTNAEQHCVISTGKPKTRASAGKSHCLSSCLLRCIILGKVRSSTHCLLCYQLTLRFFYDIFDLSNRSDPLLCRAVDGKSHRQPHSSAVYNLCLSADKPRRR